MSLLLMKSVEREVQKRFLDVASKSPVQASESLKSVFSTVKKEFGISSDAELMGKLRKSRAFRKQFFARLGAEYRKQFGVSVNVSDEKLGAAVFKLNRKLTVARARAGMVGSIGALSEEQAVKLVSLFDETARKFGMDSITFLNNYVKDEGFRLQVNEYLKGRIRELASKDKGFQALANEKPETIMAVMAGAKSAFLSTGDKAKFIAKQATNFRALGKEFAKTFASVAVTTMHQLGMAGTMPILSQIPGMGSAAFIMYYSGQYVAQSFSTVYNALRTGERESALRLFGNAVALQEMQKMQQQAMM